MISDQTRIPLVHLAWPILVENMLRTSLMSIDTFMLSRYSLDAVAAMSLVNQFAFFIQLLYMMVAFGASILISQNLGAGKRREAGLVGVASITLIVGFSLALSVTLALITRPILGLYKLDPLVSTYAGQFLLIYGGLSFFMALNIVQASILRAWGYPRPPMYVNIFALILTMAGNAFSLFGLWGFPVLGVIGVASSTVLSQFIACILFFIIMRRKKEIELPLRSIRRIPKSVYRSIFGVGVPTAGESLSYNVSQIVNMSMVAGMGTQALAAYGILIALIRYTLMPALSIGTGVQIKVGYFVGSGKHDEAKRNVYRYFAMGFLVSILAVGILNIVKRPLLGLFSEDEELIALAATVLLVSLVHEPGRSFNTIIIPALKGAGDVKFPVYAGIISNWGISVFGCWLLGVRLGLGLVGVWIAMASDEWARGIVMLFRWRSGIWKHKNLVPPAGQAPSAPLLPLAEVERGD